MTVCNGQDLDLNGSKPCRELTCEVLGKDTDETLDGAEYNTVDHNRTMTLVISTDVLSFKALRKLEVELNGSALPGTSDGILKVEVDLGTVEGTVALVYNVLKAELVKSFSQAVGCHFPIFLATHAVFGSGGKLNVIFESELGVNLVNKTNDALDLACDLIGGHKDMCIVLSEAAYTHKAVESSRLFVTVNKAKLTHTDRKIAIGVRLRLVDEKSAGTVHRLNCEILFVNGGGVHIVLVVIPVTRGLPKLTVKHNGRCDLYIACTAVDLAPVVDKGVL